MVDDPLIVIPQSGGELLFPALAHLDRVHPTHIDPWMKRCRKAASRQGDRIVEKREGEGVGGL